MRILTLLAASVLLAGCAETAIIRTHPPDAKVYVEGKYVGDSPATFTAKAHHVQRKYALRLEKDGYQTVDDVLTSHVAVGRIILDGLVTCGITWVFRGYWIFEPAAFELKPVAAAVPEPPAATVPAAESHDDDLVKKLQRLQDLLNRKLINRQEYDAYKAEVMKGL